MDQQQGSMAAQQAKAEQHAETAAPAPPGVAAKAADPDMASIAAPNNFFMSISPIRLVGSLRRFTAPRRLTLRPTICAADPLRTCILQPSFYSLAQRAWLQPH